MNPLLRKAVATIYVETAATGLWTTVARTNLPCALLHVNYRSVATAPDRAELAAERIFVWPAAEYTLPTYCQIEVNGVRWNPVATNAFERLDGPTGTTHHGRVPVRRVS